jgi:hypothetical protein
MKAITRDELISMIEKSRLADDIEQPKNEVIDFQVFSLEHLRYLINLRFGMEEK